MVKAIVMNWDAIKTRWIEIWPSLHLYIDNFVNVISFVMDGLTKFFITSFEFIKQIGRSMWQAMEPYVEIFANVVTFGMFGLVKNVIANWDQIKSATVATSAISAP